MKAIDRAKLACGEVTQDKPHAERSEDCIQTNCLNWGDGKDTDFKRLGCAGCRYDPYDRKGGPGTELWRR